ncbi:MAG: metal ABC transporter permease [Planctomycetes bacterium]|nr:metal ABC transporter permease [Planctomycetota bacterium]
MTAPSITMNVMLGTALLGATAGTIGTFAVLRRRALVGDMLSHAALPGVCIAFLIMQDRNFVGLSLGALATGLVGILVIAILTRWTRTKEDAAIGIVLSTWFGAGMVLLSVAQRQTTGYPAGLKSYLLGEAAGIGRGDVQLIALVALICLAIVSVLYKEFKLLSFDVDFATAQGWPTLVLDLVMMGTLAVVTIVGLPICGVILMAALIILPGASARFWTNRLGRLLVIAAIAGAAAGVIGTFLGSPLPKQLLGIELFDNTKYPPGPLIVLTAATFFLFSMLFAPQRGVLATAAAELQLRQRIAREHLLRALYEISEPYLPERPAVAEAQVLAQRSWRRWWVDWWLSRLRKRGLIERVNGDVRLTPAGLGAAAEVTRTHRLWEMFLVESAGIAADHVDRDADAVEHMLPKPLIRELEERLAAAGRLPMVPQSVPQSPHDL